MPRRRKPRDPAPDELRAHRRECLTLAAGSAASAASWLLHALKELDGPDADELEGVLDQALSDVRECERWIVETKR